VIADDSVLLREGLSRLLVEAGLEVAATVSDGEALLAAVEAESPDVAIVDIRMPPTFTHEGAEAAARLRARWPEIGILLLSQAIERRYALRLAQDHPTGFGYLLKDRVLDVGTLLDSIERVAAGGTVLDSDIVAHFLGGQSSRNRVSMLSEREREVLSLIAEGRSNGAIARQLHVNEKTVDSHITSIFTKLGLLPQADDHRRVLAVRAWLEPDVPLPESPARPFERDARL
jgi:DNA-binding NarL/FixJ family response regulator